jgi:hypothetical protein
VAACGANCHGAVHILPCRGPTENIVDNLPLRIRLHRMWYRDGIRVGARGAIEVAVWTRTELKKRAIERAEQHLESTQLGVNSDG